ncbi:DUF3885 domain-containing protein [Verrucosispora sp. NA02020]|uniref:DUF3885 domain-containing protein n=1 Tax=Verrucosispora sp. NA02020 TaxID=2742132 RepID=UPI003D7315FE
MIDVVVDANRLSTLWDQRWPGCSKLPYEVREIRDQWVRFHALPGSQRYPDTEIEYGIVLARHNTVLAELVTGPAVLVITAGYSDQPDPPEPGRSAEPSRRTGPGHIGRVTASMTSRASKAGCISMPAKQPGRPAASTRCYATYPTASSATSLSVT